MAESKLLTPAPLPSSRANNLPKIQRNDILRAANQTFVKPVIAKAVSGFVALNPITHMKQWAERNPITRLGLDFKANLDDIRNERDRPNREARARELRGNMANPISYAAGGAGAGSAEVIAAINELRNTTTTGFASVVAELKNLGSFSRSIARNSDLQMSELRGLKSGLHMLIESVKELAAGQKPNLEDKLESKKGVATEAEVGQKSSGLLRNLLGMLLTSASSMIGQVRMGLTLFARNLRTGIAGLATRIGTALRGIRVPRAIVALGEMLQASFARLGRFMRPIMVVIGRVSRILGEMVEIFAPIVKLGGTLGRLGGFLKFVPVVGQVLMAVLAIFDGIKGFIKGWNSTDGNFFEKAWGGLKGAVVGIVTGFLAPFKWLGELLWKGIKAIGNALNIDGFVKQLAKIDFGKIWDKVVSAFKPAGNMFKELWEMLKRVFSRILDKVVDGGQKAGAAVRGAATSARETVDAAVDSASSRPRSQRAREQEARTIAAARAAGITDRKELAMFMAQTAAESGNFHDADLEEDGYSARGVWNARGAELQRHGVTFEQVEQAHRRGGKAAMFEFMYADKYRGSGHRLGNTQEGDGNRYRGRGTIQLTGRANYRRMGQLLGLPLEEDPDLASRPDIAARIAVAFWQERNVGAAGRQGNVAEATRLVSGDRNNQLDRRTRNYNRYLDDLSDGTLSSETGTPQTRNQQQRLTNAERQRNQNKPTTQQNTVVAPTTNNTRNNTTVVQQAPTRYDRSGMDRGYRGLYPTW